MNGFHIWQLKYREKKHHPNGVNISLLNNLINASSDHCLAFIHYTANFLEMEKVTCILTMAK